MMEKCAEETQELKELKDFLEGIGGCITDDTLYSMRTILQGPGDQHLELHIMVFELESFQAEIHKMRLWLAETISAHPGQILMTALENRRIVVTFMIKERHVDTFLKFLQTDDGQIAASRRRVENIIINKRVIKIDPLKCWIKDNRKTLLDEIDSDFIETTISHMEVVPCEVIGPKMKGEMLGIVIVESGWGSIVLTVVLVNMYPSGPTARCGQLNIGESACSDSLSQPTSKNQTVVKLTVVPCAPVVEVLIKRPDVKYQLGFSVQNGVNNSKLQRSR
uniref:Amyloid beta A4 protein-binding family A member 2 n=1 Tax=Magallana gigas TaxID=29159 RepID=K1QMK7_MAGGI